MSASRRLWPASRRGCLDRHLVHLDRQARALGDQLGELDGRRVGHERDDPVRADGGGQHDVVGPGVLQLLDRARLLGPGDDHQLRAELAAGQRDEDVLGVVGHRR